MISDDANQMPTTEASAKTLLSAEQLAALANLLRRADIRASPHQCLLAQELLIRLTASGRLPPTAEEMPSLLAPIFCANADQQARFADVFAQWWESEFGSRPVVKVESPPHLVKRSWQVEGRRRLPKWAITLVLGLLTVAAAVFAWDRWHIRELRGHVLPGTLVGFRHNQSRTADGSFMLQFRASELPLLVSFMKPGFESKSVPIPETIPSDWNIELRPAALSPPPPPPPDPDTSYSRVEHLGGAAIASIKLEHIIRHPPMFALTADVLLAFVPLALAFVCAGLLHWYRRRRAPVLERMLTTTPQALREVRLAGGLHGIIPQLGVQELARDLRRRRTIPSLELDVTTSIASTLKQGGFFSPVFSSRIEPEYLLLIDRSSLQDHQAALADAFAETLEAGNVSVQRWYFDREPSRCRRSAATTAHTLTEVLELDELAARCAGHRVLMFSDGAAFFDPYTGAMRPWVEDLRRWPELVLFTLESPGRWGSREAAIERLGIVILPLSRAGIVVVSALFGGYGGERGFSAHDDDPPRVLARTARQWLDREPPAPERVARLCDELLAHLGNLGLQWLASCAVYPEVHWGITLRLGTLLISDSREMERLLPRIARLVWLREAFIPDWLRAALLHRMDAVTGSRVRAALQEMLAQAGINPGAALTLSIAVEQTNARGFWTRMGRKVVDWLRACRPSQLFRRTVRAAEPESPVRDRVFLRFMSGKRISPLGVAAPSLLARLLCPEGARALGIRSAFLWTCAVALTFSVAGWLGCGRPTLSGAAFSRDQRRILTWSADDTARLWDAADGKPLGQPMKHEWWVNGAVFSADQQRILTWSQDNTARLWDAADGKPVGQPMKHDGWVIGAAFSADQRRILTWSQDGLARLWDAADGKPLGQPMKHEGRVDGAAFSADQRRILTWSSEDGAVLLWDATSGQLVGQLKQNEWSGIGAAFSADQRRILTWSQDGTARLWDAGNGKPLGQPMKHDGRVLGAEFSADQQRILTWSVDDSARLWDATNGHPIGQSMNHAKTSTNPFAPFGAFGAEFSTDERHILTWSRDGTARLWDAADGKPVGQPMKHEGSVYGANFSADGQLILTWSEDGTARLWDAVDGKPLGQPMKHEGSVYGANFSTDQRRILTWSEDGTARLWSLGRTSGFKALLIGCDYSREQFPLKTPVTDVQALAHMLHEQYGATTTTLINPDSKMLDEELASFRNSVAADDPVWLVLAGHGADETLDQKKSFGFVLSSGESASTTGGQSSPQPPMSLWDAAEISAFLRNLPSRSAMVVADAAHAALVISGDVKTSSDQLENRARTVLASAERDQLDRDGVKHSPFARALLESLWELNGPISGSSLASEVARRMDANGVPKKQQRPAYGAWSEAGHIGGDFAFPARIAPAGPMPDFGNSRKVSAETLEEEAPKVANQFYIAANLGPASQVAFLADKLDYMGQTGWSQAQVQADLVADAQKWVSQKTKVLAPFTVKVIEPGKVVECEALIHRISENAIVTRNTTFTGRVRLQLFGSVLKITAQSELSAPALAKSSPRGILAYRVELGDTIEAIANIFNTTSQDIRALNRLNANTQPKVGDEIMVPATGVASNEQLIFHADEQKKAVIEFITRVVHSGSSDSGMTPEATAAMYVEKPDYFGRIVTHPEIIQETRKLISLWENRSYRVLEPPVVLGGLGTADVAVNVGFDYYVSSPSRGGKINKGWVRSFYLVHFSDDGTPLIQKHAEIERGQSTR